MSVLAVAYVLLGKAVTEPTGEVEDVILLLCGTMAAGLPFFSSKSSSRSSVTVLLEECRIIMLRVV